MLFRSGLLSGSAVVAALMLSGLARWWYFQAGVYGFAANLALCVVLGFLRRSQSEEEARTSKRFFDPFAAQQDRRHRAEV